MVRAAAVMSGRDRMEEITEMPSSPSPSSCGPVTSLMPPMAQAGMPPALSTSTISSRVSARPTALVSVKKAAPMPM